GGQGGPRAVSSAPGTAGCTSTASSTASGSPCSDDLRLGAVLGDDLAALPGPLLHPALDVDRGVALRREVGHDARGPPAGAADDVERVALGQLVHPAGELGHGVVRGPGRVACHPLVVLAVVELTGVGRQLRHTT